MKKPEEAGMDFSTGDRVECRWTGRIGTVRNITETQYECLGYQVDWDDGTSQTREQWQVRKPEPDASRKQDTGRNRGES